MAKSKHFMVVLCGDFSQRLEIPRKFLKHIEGAQNKLEKGPKAINLADSTGKTWCVSIEKEAHRAHLTSGWRKFAREHKLQENEFLVFRYDGSQQFSVVILDDMLCEREMTEEEVAKRSPEVVSLSDSDSDSARSESRDNDEDMSEEDDSEDNESESSVMNDPRKRRAFSPYPSFTKKMRGQVVSCRRAVTDMEKQKAALDAFSFSSKYPYFMIRMSANMVYCWSSLRFPIRFSKDHLPRERAKFMLRNSVGQKWRCSYYTEGVQPSGKGLLSRGWSHFARDNNLEEDDYCVFELVKSREFLVHIFRVVEKVVPPVWVPR